ncbi:MAG: hypothetical protein JJU28_03050 [Cyclobacteriaceae bacterium]|nr:hypothetical protein [Cyclobacteriaceae bacterium]
MKVLKIKYLLVSTLITSMVLFISCEEIPEELELNEFQRNAQILDVGSPWGGQGKVQVLNLPTGVNEQELSNLSLSFGSSGRPEYAPSNFVAAGANDFIFAPSGNWNWTTSTSVIQLSGASITQISAVDITEQQITFSFELSPSSSTGRISGVDGNYRVTLQRN